MGELESVLPFPHCFQNTQIAKSRAKGAIDDRGPGVPPSNPVTSVSFPFQRKPLIPAWTLCSQPRGPPESGSRPSLARRRQPRRASPSPEGNPAPALPPSPSRSAAPASAAQPGRPRSFPASLHTTPHAGTAPERPASQPTYLPRATSLGGWSPELTGLVGPESFLGAEPGRD